MAHTKKPSRMMGNKGRIQTVSRPRLSGKVAAEPSEGVSVSRNEKKSFLRNGIKYLPVILERSEESGKGYKN